MYMYTVTLILRYTDFPYQEKTQSIEFLGFYKILLLILHIFDDEQHSVC